MRRRGAILYQVNGKSGMSPLPLIRRLPPLLLGAAASAVVSPVPTLYTLRARTTLAASLSLIPLPQASTTTVSSLRTLQVQAL
jgi:hypothetical protein